MKKLLTILLILTLTSCSVKQKADRKIKWLKANNYLNGKKDTIREIIPEFKDTGSTKLIIEHDTVEKWREKDSCFTKERVSKILSKAKIKPVNIDNDRIALNIKVENGEIKYDYKVKEIIVEKPIEIPVLKDCPKERWWDSFWIGAGSCAAFIFILGFLLTLIFNKNR